MKQLMEKVENCFKASAIATGCSVSCKWRELGTVRDLVHNEPMAELYAKYKREQGAQFPERAAQQLQPVASSDIGNVSYTMPVIHPMVKIEANGPNHTKDFASATGTDAAHKRTFEATKCLVMPAVYVLLDERFFQAVKEDYKNSVPEKYQDGFSSDEEQQ